MVAGWSDQPPSSYAFFGYQISDLQARRIGAP